MNLKTMTYHLIQRHWGGGAIIYIRLSPPPLFATFVIKLNFIIRVRPVSIDDQTVIPSESKAL